MKRIVSNAYQLKELSEEAKQIALAEFVQTLPSNWDDHIKEQFVLEAAGKGFRVDEILYSGFGSQGDGAMFEGVVSDWGKFTFGKNLTATLDGAKEENPDVMELITLSITHNPVSRYYHKYTAIIRCMIDKDDLAIDYDEARDLERCIELEVNIIYCELCKSLYRSLENEYNFIISMDYFTTEMASMEDPHFNEYGQLISYNLSEEFEVID